MLCEGVPVRALVQPDDMDFYVIFVPRPGHVTVEAWGYPVTTRLWAHLYSCPKSLRGCETRAADERFEPRIAMEADLEGGRYFVRIVPNTQYERIDAPYTLVWNLSP
jgi:hypothetical protein